MLKKDCNRQNKKKWFQKFLRESHTNKPLGWQLILFAIVVSFSHNVREGDKTTIVDKIEDLKNIKKEELIFICNSCASLSCKL